MLLLTLLTVGELATFKATSVQISRNDRLTWGRVGTTIYDGLAENGVDTSNCEFKSMILRANLIVSLGEGSDVCDPRQIYNWFKSRSLGTLSEISAQLDDHNSMSKLRQLRNRIYVLSVLSSRVSLPEDLLQWITLMPKLP